MSYAVEIDAYTLPAGPLVTKRYSSGRGFLTLGSDTPANTMFYPRLEQPYRVRRDLFEKATTFGGISTGSGEIILQNADGVLDDFLNFGFDGREVRIYQGEEGEAFPSQWTQIGTGYVDTVEHLYTSVRVTLQDRLQQLDKPLLSAKYAGTNALPLGVEGVDDIKDQYKPRLYGYGFRISPKCVNTSKFIYQVSDQTATVSAVKDRGVALVAGAAYVSQVDMETTAPAAGGYRVWTSASGCYVRVNTPTGTITVDASTTEVRAAELIEQIALDMGIGSGDISSADVTALNTDNSADVGVWVDGDMTALEAMNELAAAVAASFYFDSLGVLHMARLEAPSGSPVFSVIQARITDLELVSTADTDKGIPPWAVKLGYQKNYTPESDLAGAAAADIPIARDEYRRVSSEDATVLTPHPKSVPMVFDTVLKNKADASTEATRRLDLYKVGRQMYNVTARLTEAQIALLELNTVITLTHRRYGLSAGEDFRVIGIDIDAEAGDVRMRLWK